MCNYAHFLTFYCVFKIEREETLKNATKSSSRNESSIHSQQTESTSATLQKKSSLLERLNDQLLEKSESSNKRKRDVENSEQNKHQVKENEEIINEIEETAGNSILHSPKTPLPIVHRTTSNNIGFAFASGKNVAVNKSAISSLKRKFDQEEKRMKITEIDETSAGLCEITGNSTMLSPKTPLQTSTPYVRRSLRQAAGKDGKFSNASVKNTSQSEITNIKLQFSKKEINETLAENSTMPSPKTPLQTSTPIVRRTHYKEPENTIGFASASGKNIAVDENKLSSIKLKFDREEKKMKIKKIDETAIGLCENNGISMLNISKIKAIELPGTSNFLSTQYDALIDYNLIDQVRKSQTTKNF